MSSDVDSDQKRVEFIKPNDRAFLSAVENARDEGYRAYQDDRYLADNPYVWGCENWQEWRNGYKSAELDDELDL